MNDGRPDATCHEGGLVGGDHLHSLGPHNHSQLLESRPVGLVIGAFWKRPLVINLVWMMKSGPSPFPMAADDLALMAAELRAGRAVALHASEQAAIDAGRAAVEWIAWCDRAAPACDGSLEP